MEKFKMLMVTNALSYISFIIFIILRWQNLMKGVLALSFGFAPYIIVGFSSIIFFAEPKQLKKKIRLEQLFDLMVRIIAMIFCFIIANKSYNETNSFLMLGLILVMFLCNLYLEYTLYNKLKDNIGIDYLDGEITLEQRYIINSNINLKEFLYLFLAVLLIVGMKDNDKIGYIKFYFIPFIVLMYLYIQETYRSLKEYYKEKEKVKKLFFIENVTVFIMIIVYIAYKILFVKVSPMTNFLVSILLWSFTIPKFAYLKNRNS